MFKNAYTYNPVVEQFILCFFFTNLKFQEDSQVYSDAKTLEKFFDEQLEKFLPEYAYEQFEDEELPPPAKKYKRIISD